MAQWNDAFDTVKEQLQDELSITGIPSLEERANNLFWSLIYSWEHEDESLVWVTSKPDTGVDPYRLSVFHYAPYELRVIIGVPK